MSHYLDLADCYLVLKNKYKELKIEFDNAVGWAGQMPAWIFINYKGIRGVL
jgi:hypothetical protein